MNRESIIRAWKDPAYRASLSSEQRAELPEHPSGVVELDDTTLGEAVGGGLSCGIGRIRIISQWVDGCASVFCPFLERDIRINPQVAVRF